GEKAAGRQEVSVPLSEEELKVGKRAVEAGRVRLRKVVHTEHVAQPVQLRREEVTVERLPAGGTQVPPDAFQEKEVAVPLMREEPVVAKEPHVTGGAEIQQTQDAE